MSLLSDPWYGGGIAEPADTDLMEQCTGLFVWEAGNLEFMTARGDIIGPYAVAAGTVVPYQIKQVRAATTATVSLGLSR